MAISRDEFRHDYRSLAELWLTLLDGQAGEDSAAEKAQIEQELGYEIPASTHPGLPFSREPVVEDPEDAPSRIVGIEARPSTEPILSKKMEAFQIPHLVDLCAAVAELPGTQAYAARNGGSGSSQDTRWAARCLLTDGIRRLCRSDSLKVQEDRWISVADALQSLFFDGQLTRRAVVPLLGLSFKEPLEIPGAVLRPLPIAERLAMPWHLPQRVEARCCIEATHVEDCGKDGDSGPSLQKRMSYLVQALRLWSGLPIYSLLVQLGYEPSLHCSANISPLPSIVHHLVPRPLPDAAGFSSFWSNSEESLQSPPRWLGVALRRYNTMWLQPREGDRILDECIILEALFQHGDEKAELNYRLGLRVARFLGSSHEDRKRICSLVRTAYGIRSKIAHGEDGSAKDQEALTGFGEIVRRGLLKYIDAHRKRPFKSVKEFVAAIDEQFLS